MIRAADKRATGNVKETFGKSALLVFFKLWLGIFFLGEVISGAGMRGERGLSQ